jgi:hypothetical protein
MDELLQEASKVLFSNGILGVAVAGLVYYIMMQRGENRDERAAHKIELAEKDKLIVELYDRLVNQAQAMQRGLEAVQGPLERIAASARNANDRAQKSR